LTAGQPVDRGQTARSTGQTGSPADFRVACTVHRVCTHGVLNGILLCIGMCLYIYAACRFIWRAERWFTMYSAASRAPPRSAVDPCGRWPPAPLDARAVTRSHCHLTRSDSESVRTSACAVTRSACAMSVCAMTPSADPMTRSACAVTQSACTAGAYAVTRRKQRPAHPTAGQII
jgi:hypothetical protein